MGKGKLPEDGVPEEYRLKPGKPGPKDHEPREEITLKPFAKQPSDEKSQDAERTIKPDFSPTLPEKEPVEFQPYEKAPKDTKAEDIPDEIKVTKIPTHKGKKTTPAKEVSEVSSETWSPENFEVIPAVVGQADDTVEAPAVPSQPESKQPAEDVNLKKGMAPVKDQELEEIPWAHPKLKPSKRKEYEPEHVTVDDVSLKKLPEQEEAEVPVEEREKKVIEVEPFVPTEIPTHDDIELDDLELDMPRQPKKDKKPKGPKKPTRSNIPEGPEQESPEKGQWTRGPKPEDETPADKEGFKVGKGKLPEDDVPEEYRLKPGKPGPKDHEPREENHS